jgi:hypothetical protein
MWNYFRQVRSWNLEGVGKMANRVEVVFAVYGAIDSTGDCKAGDVKGVLQQLLNKVSNGVVTINNVNMSYKDIGTNGLEKHFAAIVKYNGTMRAFACQEGQTIDFSAAA